MRFATIDRVEPVARNNNDAPRPGIEFAEEVVGESVGRAGGGYYYDICIYVKKKSSSKMILGN